MRFAGQYTATSDTIKALRLAKEAGLTPDKLRAILEANLAYIDVLEPFLAEILAPALSNKKIEQLGRTLEKIPEQGINKQIAPLLSLTAAIKESFAVAARTDAGL